MKDDWKSRAEQYERQRLEMTPEEKRYERENNFGGGDWFKLFLVFVVIYYFFRIVAMVIE